MERIDNNFSEITLPSVNDIHDEALHRQFEISVGKKVFILSPSYPFVFIGRILRVVGDTVVVDVETTTVGELEHREWFIHLDQIEVFYIEQRGLPRIPELRDGL